MFSDEESQLAIRRGQRSSYSAIIAVISIVVLLAGLFIGQVLLAGGSDFADMGARFREWQETLLREFAILDDKNAIGDSYGFLALLATIGIAVAVSLVDGYGRLRRVSAQSDSEDREWELRHSSQTQIIGMLQFCLIVACTVISLVLFVASVGRSHWGITIACVALFLFFLIESSRSLSLIWELDYVRVRPNIGSLKKRMSNLGQQERIRESTWLWIIEIIGYLAFAALIWIPLTRPTDPVTTAIGIGTVAAVFAVVGSWLIHSQALESSYQTGISRFVSLFLAYFVMILGTVTLVTVALSTVTDPLPWYTWTLAGSALIGLIVAVALRTSGYSGKRPVNALWGFRLDPWSAEPMLSPSSKPYWLLILISTVELVLPAFLLTRNSYGSQFWLGTIVVSVLLGSGVLWPYFSPAPSIRWTRKGLVLAVAGVLLVLSVRGIVANGISVERALLLAAVLIWTSVLLLNYFASKLPERIRLLCAPRLLLDCHLDSRSENLCARVKETLEKANGAESSKIPG